MAKSKSQYQCQQCGAKQSKWAGQCPECQAWNSLEEVRAVAAGPARRGGYAGAVSIKPSRLAEISEQLNERLVSGIDELDRVLGGGLVPGSVLLLGGDPGIGKSTLLLQMLAALAGKLRCLYVTGEESLEQVSLRARRLKLDREALFSLAETEIERILAVAEAERPGLMVIDSIQTMHSSELSSAPGSVSQVRDSAAALVRWAKETGCAVVLVGHVTKEGSLAGPRVLEHMVDTVLYFESDGSTRYRLVRAVKNRFGAVNELGMFAMTGTGLKQVRNPSSLFLTGHDQPVSGSAITVVREGTRPLLLELQALVDPSRLNNPRRVALGLDSNRLAMLLAILHRHGGLNLSEYDVFVNVVGGVRVQETSTDLAVLLALWSSFHDRPLPQGLVCFGECGLSGELRPVPDGQERLKAAAGHGFKSALIPAANAPRKASGLNVSGLRNVAEALRMVAQLVA